MSRRPGLEVRLRGSQRGRPQRGRPQRGRAGAEDVVLRQVAPVRVAELTATAASYGRRDTGPAVQPLYPELLRRLAAAGVQPATGMVIAYYQDPAEPSDAVIVHAAIPLPAGPRPGGDFTVVDLPAIGCAATILHRGPTDEIIQSLQILAGWIQDNGYRPVGCHREVYLDFQPGQAGQGLTELQVPLATGPHRQAPELRIHVLI